MGYSLFDQASQWNAKGLLNQQLCVQHTLALVSQGL